MNSLADQIAEAKLIVDLKREMKNKETLDMIEFFKKRKKEPKESED